MILYIAGKMTGLPDLGRHKFADVEERLKRKGHVVLNPCTVPVGLPKNRYLPICLAMIDAADGVYMMDNWETSPGARVEMEYASYQGKEILFEKEDTVHGDL